MTKPNLVYLQLMQSVKEKTIKREFEVKEEDVVNYDAYTGGTYQLGGNVLKEKVLKGISVEEVYKLQFDCIDEAETFYNIALLIDESVGTYEWVLETFLIAMMNKKPISIVTYGDKSMRKAIKKALPDACHRLSSWHLQRNAFTNVHIKDFTSIFARCMFKRGNAEELKRAILRIRQNEAKTEFELNNSSPVLSTKLSILENHATKESFLKFQEEIKNVELFFVVGLVEHLEEIPHSCILKRWTKLAKMYTRSTPANETDNDMDRFVRYGSLSLMCNKLSYYASNTSSSFLEAKNEIENLTVRMEELYNSNLKGKKVAVDGAISPNQVRDLNIVKTKGNLGKVATNFQKGRQCSRCKRVGHTIQMCTKARIPQTGH
ncbi:hypothetical protein CK203_114174 [Vitis vinifera]|uniref:MULE transposase domain-containing protein n=1 Tax=Vitis vinifera TaxID=29760 RepID=A0A438CAP9_VITVI|nr:hypothetical protein CK203_114174 [Vitis vinifera]